MQGRNNAAVIPSQEYLHGQDGTRSHPAASGVRPGAGGREGTRLPPRACSVPGPRGVHGGGEGKGSGAIFGNYVKISLLEIMLKIRFVGNYVEN